MRRVMMGKGKTSSMAGRDDQAGAAELETRVVETRFPARGNSVTNDEVAARVGWANAGQAAQESWRTQLRLAMCSWTPARMGIRHFEYGLSTWVSCSVRHVPLQEASGLQSRRRGGAAAAAAGAATAAAATSRVMEAKDNRGLARKQGTGLGQRKIQNSSLIECI